MDSLRLVLLMAEILHQLIGSPPTMAWQLSQVLPGQLVSATPELRLVELDLTLDRFVVLACDGIWDVLQELSFFFREGI